MQKEPIDTLGRRKRFKRSPSGKRTAISERVLLILEALHWYGDLPTTYLYELQKHIAADKFGTRKLLGELYHEHTYRFQGAHYDLPQRNGLLDRPHQQLRAEWPLGNEVVHSISEQGIELLKKAGRYVPHAFKPSPPWEHSVMQSCIMASLAIEARRHGLTFIPQHELINTPQVTFDIDGIPLRPDGVVAMEREGRRFYLFIEADRDTEANKPRNEKKRRRKGKYWIDSVRLYQKLIGEKRYKTALDTKANDAALVLNVTVNPGHMENQIETIKEALPNGSAYILSQYYECFAWNFKPPPVLPLLSTPWKRAGYEDMRLVKK